MNGATILALGVFLGSLQSIFRAFRPFFLVFYTGYPLWGAVFVRIHVPLTIDRFLDTTARNVLDY